MTITNHEDLRACIARIYRKAEIMRMDSKTPVSRGDAHEILALAEVALRYMDGIKGNS